MKRSGRLRQRSKKMEAVYVERRILVSEFLHDGRRCQGRPLIDDAALTLVGGDTSISPMPHDAHALFAAGANCQRFATEVHEIKKRSRGGSILDSDNCLALCHNCHRFTEDEPRLATLAGMLRPSWNR